MHSLAISGHSHKEHAQWAAPSDLITQVVRAFSTPQKAGNGFEMSADDAAAQSAVVTELDSAQSYDLLKENPNAVLIDVRTRAEWAYVGVPDLSGLGRSAILIEWQTFPDMMVNGGFADALEAEIGTERDRPLLFLCRSGARSHAAATAAIAHGYRRCINVSDGFEGDLDQDRRRGRLNGWKARGLPWIQT